MKTYTLYVSLIILSLTMPAATTAQGYLGGKGLIYAYAGATFANINTSAYFETPYPQVNRTLDLESDLLFPSTSTLFYGKILFGGRFQLLASYMSLHRSGDARVSREIAIGDSVYSVGARVSGFFNTNYLSGSLRFSILRTPIATAGISLGARYLNLDAGIRAESSGYVFDRSETFDVPVVVPGIHASVYALPSLLLRGSVEYFELKVSGTKGKVLEVNLAAEYYLLRYLGVGVGYMMNKIDATGLPENDVYLQDVNFDVSGLQLFAAFRF